MTSPKGLFEEITYWLVREEELIRLRVVPITSGINIGKV